MTTKRAVVAALLGLAFIFAAMPGFAKNAKTVTKGPIVINEFKHDTGPLLREIAPLLPEYSMPSEHEIENMDNPNHPWSNEVKPDPVLQRPESGPMTLSPPPGLEFDGLGLGDSFFCNCMPPDNDGAPGTTQYVQYINLFYAVYDKTGNRLLGPLKGNSFCSGFGGSCQSDNSGDPIVRFDAAAQRWVVSQFAINSAGNDFECIAVSKTADATGSYNRYGFSFANFPDYPKMGVWPDGYYFTFNNFNLAGTAFVGANVCAADRNAMLAGNSAQIVCFQQNSQQFGMLAADLEGPTPPAAGTPNFVMELDPSGSANIDMFNFHVDFTNPSNSTFTGPVKISVASFTPLCPTQQRGRCVKQPSSNSDLLESLGNRLMWRLVYRNFGDHTTLLATHSITVGSSGGVRWYEMRNPESGTPTIFQSGTFAPDSQFRWMPAITMDQNQNIAVAYSRSGSGSGQYPSLVYAGRVPSDPSGTLEDEQVLKLGLGSQTGGGDRWGDYTSLAIDPTDDCTFWFTEEYQKQDGGFDWSTAVGTFSFPGCGGGGNPDFTLSANPTSVSIAQGSSGTSTITVNPIGGFTGSVNLQASGLPTGVTANFNPNPTTSTSLMTITVSSGAPTGTSTVTITGTSGSLTHTTSVQLTITGQGGPIVSLAPTSLAWGKVLVGQTATGKKKVILTNTGTADLHISTIATTGDFALFPVTQTKKVTPCVNGSVVHAGGTCQIKVSFTPTQKGLRTGAVNFTDDAPNSPQSVALSGTGK
ncbi:MAG TPA: choice-of-anchor D domain-containing protein [Terriglobales bacterium]|nr:choice-of-anchor D domain-containing protein [Terriglobales bacterium]